MIRLRTASLPRSPEGSVGIVGGGNSAHALAAYLAKHGSVPHIYARNPAKLADLAQSHRLRATGVVDGLFAVARVTGSPAELLADCKTVFICTVATAYTDVARQLAPHITPEHELIVFSSKLFGSVEVASALERLGSTRPSIIVETDALIAARLQPDGSITMRGIKGWNLAATPNPADMERGTALVQRFFPQVEQAVNLVHRGLTDFGALVHPLTVLANVNRVDRGESFLFYVDGFTPRTAALLEALESELAAIARAFGASLIPARELLDRYYGCHTNGTLLDAMRSVPNYRTSVAPPQLDHRYLQEDVSCTLVPARELARKAGLETPMLDAVVSMAGVLLGPEVLRDARTLARLSLGDLDADELRDRFNGRQKPARATRYELVS